MRFRKNGGLKKMKYINDLVKEMQISKIGLGTGRFGTVVDEEKAFELMDCYATYGGNVLDTARNYYEWVENGHGKSEECIGKWMHYRNNRQKICICTKGGVSNEGKNWTIDISEKKLIEEIQSSMDALQTDYIDIYLLHRDERNTPIEEVVETMQKVRGLGKIKVLGVANWSVERVKKANEYAVKHGLEPFRIVQTWWSLAEYTKEMWNDDNTTHMESEMYEYLKENSYVGMAYTSQCKGYFQKAINYGIENIDPFLRKRIETNSNLKKLEYIKDYCKRSQVSPTAVVTGYITNNSLRGIALVSTSKLEQLKDVMENCSYVLPEQVIYNIDNCIEK